MESINYNGGGVHENWREQSVVGEHLTIGEAAAALRCSKAHVYNLINGKVPHTPKLPCVQLGRRKLVRTETLRTWTVAVEQGS
jgi:excisionase family DNA binding protein